MQYFVYDPNYDPNSPAGSPPSRTPHRDGKFIAEAVQAVLWSPPAPSAQGRSCGWQMEFSVTDGPFIELEA
jgi:hypothetical protein